MAWSYSILAPQSRGFMDCMHKGGIRNSKAGGVYLVAALPGSKKVTVLVMIGL